MTNMKKTLKGLIAMLVALAMTVALGVSMLASAAEDGSVAETVVVTQVFAEDTTPNQPAKYEYVLTPKRAENPMPEGTVNGKYTVGTIDGESSEATAPSFVLMIDASKPGVYEYILERNGTTPEGNSISPESHIFGYKVEIDETTGELVAKPYICQSGEPSYYSNPDGSGYPTQLTLINTITGPKKGQDGKDGNDGQNGKDGQNGTNGKDGKNGTNGKDGKNGTNGTNGKNGTNGTVAKGVNTGDESNLILWVVVLSVAVAGFLLAVLLRRRKEDDDEQDF